MRPVLAAVLCAALLTSGCTSDNPRGEFMDERRTQDAQLRERPTSEVQVARLTAARDAIRERLAMELALTAWSDRDNRDVAGCSDLDQSSGRTVFVSSLLLTGGVPDAVWPQAVNLLQQTSATFGFGAVDVVVDRPGEHEIVLRGEWGSLLRFGTSKNATLSLETGCHLPEGVG